MSPVVTMFFSKNHKSTVYGLEVAQPVCVSPPPYQMAAVVDPSTAAVPQFLDGPSAASAPAAAAAIIL